MGTLAGLNVAVGVGGGIAAYKACDLVRELRRQGAQVRVAMTEAASAFVTALTFQSLSGHPVLTHAYDPKQEAGFGHLALARWADLFVVAPATADLCARIRAGMANDAVTTCLVAFRGPVVLAPAMNTAMWENSITQDNVRALLTDGRFSVVGPGVGPLADGDVGAGRLADLPDMVRALKARALVGPLSGRRVLITAGPTREAIDPVRFISNASTGKMGLAMAEVARARGAQVTVVLGPVAAGERGRFEIIDVVTAEDMAREVLQRVNDVDVFVAAAAVGDYRPQDPAALKMKKTDAPALLSLVRTPDVLAEASAQVHALERRPLLVGFAAETHDVLAFAREKLLRKKLDFIVANDVTVPGAGFGTDSNQVTVVDNAGSELQAQGSKREVAQAIWDCVVPKLPAQRESV